ncbi:MAG: hypothetical protein QNI98_04830 [Woeseiaceae bacterium]|nr:hypothetical protein [Woeseiaceae bacterium]
MTFIGIIFCLAIVLIAGTGVVSPPAFLTIIRRLTSLQGFYLVAVLRIAFGAVLYLAAPVSQMPTLIEITGIVVFVSGVVTPFFSHRRYRKVVEWWAGGGDLYIRIWAGCAIIFALLLGWVLLPKEFVLRIFGI